MHLASLIEDVKVANRTAVREEFLNYCALNCKERGVAEKKYGNQDIIVSLTTHGKRLNQVYLTIESLMQQSLKPNKIILWLSDDYQHKFLPPVLKRQENRGLEIHFCEDIRSYKKLVPALKKYPEAAIITADDDLYYHYQMIENLVFSHLDNPEYIYFNRGFKIKLNNERTIGKYSRWKSVTTPEVSPLNFPTGGGGTLYPAGCFNEEVFNRAVFEDICPLADDVWFKAMSLYNGVQSKKSNTVSANGDDFLVNKSVQDIGLTLLNNGKNQNDVQIKAVFNRYDLFPLLSL